jgi:NO-binding membrane sensor protein with MHYT domain
MESINEIATHYDGLLKLISALIGVLGFFFGIWRYVREKLAKRELADARSKLKHLEKYAEGLKKY